MPKVRILDAVPDVTAISADQIGVLCEIVSTAMQRNYPEATTEMVEDLLDLGNARNVLSAVLTGSGLKPAAEGEAEAGGPIGAPSMGSSPPPSDGPTL
jgi:hypothetical protein